MKKLIIAALIAVTAAAGVISASASCGYCPNGECINAGYCIEEWPNNCIPKRDGTGAQRRMGRGGRCGGYHCGDFTHCTYR